MPPATSYMADARGRRYNSATFIKEIRTVPTAKRFELPFRQIHLDFHTGPWIRDVGRDFDAREFARTMKKAHVNSVTTFAKCHHGHLYYDTQRPERHPGLKKGLN